MRVYILLFIVCSTFCEGSAFKILAVFHLPTPSHYAVGHALLKGLVEAGHEVTMISPFKQKHPIKNYNEIYLENSLSDAIKGTRAGNFLNYNNIYFGESEKVLIETSYNFTISALRSQNFQNFLREDHQFNVVIVDLYFGEALLGLGQFFNAPTIAFSTTVPSKWSADLIGLSPFASYVPNIYNGFSDKMNFWERMYNSLSYFYDDIAVAVYHNMMHQRLLESYWPNKSNVPSFVNVKKNISVVFVNSHVSYSISQPVAPNLIEIGGIHINESDISYTEDVQAFLNSAKDGAIFLSVGSQIKLSKIPISIQNMIANAFSEFPNIRILIKNEEDFVIPSHKKSDVLVKPWFNQMEILSHPNLKLFISHGGLLSTTESVHFGKPLICIPIFYDQYINSKAVEAKKYGVNVPLEKISEEKLKAAIRAVLTEPSYAKTAKDLSERFHDRISTPMETAIHWVEHVAKFKGTSHLRSAGLDLPFMQFYNLDCWCFILIVCFTFTYTIFTLIKLFYRSVVQRIFSKNIKVKLT